MEDFVSFSKIAAFGKLRMSITQKIHGTNAQIYIKDGEIKAGSRNRWVFPGDDNYGFAAFVENNKSELIDKLGDGRHFGEWAGPGINSGEGLSDKKFILFDWWKYPEERELPPQTTVVPVLYSGRADLSKVEDVMSDLKKNGSKLAEGFMHPEGIVIDINGAKFKKVFEAEDTAWSVMAQRNKNQRKSERDRLMGEALDKYGHLLQPIRLQKLLSRDEAYIVYYPESLPAICNDYFKDLVEEGQIAGEDDEIKIIRKAMVGALFQFVKSHIQI